MKPRTRDEGGQALQEFQRGHHEVGSAIAVRRFELQHDLAGRTVLCPRRVVQAINQMIFVLVEYLRQNRSLQSILIGPWRTLLTALPQR